MGKGSKGVFRFEGFVEGTKLPDLHWALNNLATGLTVQPVANATIAGGQVQAIAQGDVVDVFKRWLVDNRHVFVNATLIKEFQRHVGRSESGYSSLLHRCIDAGVLRPAKKDQRARGSRYIVVGSQQALPAPARTKVRA